MTRDRMSRGMYLNVDWSHDSLLHGDWWVCREESGSPWFVRIRTDLLLLVAMISQIGISSETHNI